MEGKSDVNKMDDVILPGFRFHPTDEELVGFYLKRKIQNRTLPMEVIKQVDIYKYDPWDLPKLACSGEKEWYFYCPRDRKYRNSTRPNRVTVAGFWKATGTDRPIYASGGTECIGLKKSLVFYGGKAAKGIKTNWMMHEFRLPSSATSTPPPKNFSDKTLLPNDSWAICRIFKKTNTMAQRALSRSWVSHDARSSAHILNQGARFNLFSPAPMSCKTETGSPVHLSADNPSFSALEVPVCEPIIDPTHLKSHPFPFLTEYLSPIEMPKSTISVASMPFNIPPVLINTDIGKILESVDFQEQQQSSNLGVEYSDNEWGNTELKGFPFGLSSNVLDTWKTDYIWDSPPGPSDIPNTFSTN